MKKTKRIIVAVMAFSAILLVASCATYQVSKDFKKQQVDVESEGTPIAYIHAKNYGYYLFNVVPLISGDCENIGATSWFIDNVNPQNAVDLLTKKAKALGASKTVCLQTTHRESGAYTFWIFWYRGSQASGTAIK